jgi:hypothetical protein
VATIGPFSTAQAVELVAIGAGFDTGQNFTITPPTIDGVTATIRGTGTATDTCMATNITSAQINNGSAVITGSVTPGAWSMNGVAFKEQSSGPTLWAQGMV